MTALVFATAQSLIFFLYAAGYSFGAYLVAEGRNTYEEIFRSAVTAANTLTYPVSQFLSSCYLCYPFWSPYFCLLFPLLLSATVYQFPFAMSPPTELCGYYLSLCPLLNSDRTFAAVVFTALTLGRASSFAPDASRAQASAARILQLLKTKPQIDTTSAEGMQPVS